MNNPEQKITPLQNSEDHEKLVQEYEAKIEKEKADKEKWKNAYLKSEQNRLEIGQAQERTAEERDDWKRQAFANRKIELEKKQNKEQNDFKTEYIKLQEQKGWKWSEERGWTR